MSKPRISIVGLGAIGKAIGQTLCMVGGQLEVMGHDRDPVIAREAQRLGAVNRIHWNLLEACDGADVVIIAIPLPGYSYNAPGDLDRSETRMSGDGHRQSEGSRPRVGR